MDVPHGVGLLKRSTHSPFWHSSVAVAVQALPHFLDVISHRGVAGVETGGGVGYGGGGTELQPH